MVDNIKNFLYDQKYFISFFDNSIHVFNYIDLIELTTTKIVLKLELFNVVIKGKNLKVKQMVEKELVVTGEIYSVELVR